MARKLPPSETLEGLNATPEEIQAATAWYANVVFDNHVVETAIKGHLKKRDRAGYGNTEADIGNISELIDPALAVITYRAHRQAAVEWLVMDTYTRTKNVRGKRSLDELRATIEPDRAVQLYEKHLGKAPRDDRDSRPRGRT